MSFSNNKDLTPQKLKIAYFLVTKRRLLKKIFIGFLITINLIIWFFFFSNFILYLMQSKEYQEMEKELTRSINYQELHQVISPLVPEVFLSKAIFLGRAKYHFVCGVKNPNKNWHIESLDYRFSWQDGQSSILTNFLLPGEEKFLVSFNETITQTPLNFSCQIENIKWRRVRPEKFPLLEIPKSFLIRDLRYLPATEEKARDITLFKFVNLSIYDFWQIDLVILLYQGREVVVVERTSLKEIMSQEEREVKIIWPTSFSFISEVKVIPEVNVLDPSSFISPKLKLEKR